MTSTTSPTTTTSTTATASKRAPKRDEIVITFENACKILGIDLDDYDTSEAAHAWAECYEQEDDADVSGEELQERYLRSVEEAERELQRQVRSALLSTLEDALGEIGLETIGGVSPRGKIRIRPLLCRKTGTRTWAKAVAMLHSTCDGFGLCTYPTLQEWADDVAWPSPRATHSRRVVQASIGWLSVYPDVYGVSSWRRQFDEALR